MRLVVNRGREVFLEASHPSSGRQLLLKLERKDYSGKRFPVKGRVLEVPDAEWVELEDGRLRIKPRREEEDVAPYPVALDFRLRGDLFGLARELGIRIPPR